MKKQNTCTHEEGDISNVHDIRNIFQSIFCILYIYIYKYIYNIYVNYVILILNNQGKYLIYRFLLKKYTDLC